jgi:glycosyltransferase involved in cell wall biosynthesis
MISVVIPTYNRPLMLIRAVRSVLAQTYRDFEIIVVDDCSVVDPQAELAREFAAALKEGKIRYFRNTENRDKSFCRNFGVRQSVGEYLAFLDDDDTWFPIHLESLHRCFESHREIDLVYANAILYFSSGEWRVKVGDLETGTGRKYRDAFLMGRLGFSSCVVLKKNAFWRAGGFDEQVSVYEDRLLYSKVALQGEVYFSAQPTVGMFPGRQSYSFRLGQEKMAALKAEVCDTVLFLAKSSGVDSLDKVATAMFYDLSVQFSYFDSVRAIKYLMRAVRTDIRFCITFGFWRQLIFILRGKGLRTERFPEIFD